MDAGTAKKTGRAIIAGPTDGQTTGSGCTLTATATMGTTTTGRPTPANHAPTSAIPATLGPATVRAAEGTIEERRPVAPASPSTTRTARPIANPATIPAIPALQAPVAAPAMPIMPDCSSREIHTVAARRDTTTQALSAALPATRLASAAPELPPTTA